MRVVCQRRFLVAGWRVRGSVLRFRGSVRVGLSQLRSTNMDITIQHVLAPVDFGPLSGRVLDFAEAIACGPHAKVHLVHVLEQPFITAGAYEFLLPDTPSRRERLYV